MSNFPKPSFVISQPNFSLVWFESTNHFLIVQKALEVFFSEALTKTKSEYQVATEKLICAHTEFKSLMQAVSKVNTNSITKENPVSDFKHLSLCNFEVSKFTFTQCIVSVYYDSKKLQTIFEAPYTHLKNNCVLSNKELIISEKDNKLRLFRNKKLIYNIHKNHFFVLQAQFANQITESYHNISSSSWLCAFHACAVQKDNKTFLLLGDSGAGKSTLSSLLSLFDYRFIADDLVLMDHDFKIYDNPAAVSIKENSWPIIENHYRPFTSLKTSKKVKGQTRIKFLPLHKLQNNKPKSFNVNALVWVNFSKDQTHNLIPLDKKEVLSRLIPDTWIYSQINSAKAFAHWALGIKSYHLDYSDFIVAKELLDAKI